MDKKVTKILKKTSAKSAATNKAATVSKKTVTSNKASNKSATTNRVPKTIAVRDLLFEIGVEEMPSAAVFAALDELKKAIPEKFASARLSHGKIYLTATPRRFIVHIADIPEKQAEAETTNRGPAVRAAFEKFADVTVQAYTEIELKKLGPTKALEGFMRSQGVTLKNILIQNDSGNDYVYAHKKLDSQNTVQILPELISDIVSGIHFSRLMSFDKNIKFIRPLRWILAFYGSTKLGVRLGDIVSGNVTYGHRFLSPSRTTIKESNLKSFLSILKKAHVIADIDERRDLIVKGLEKAASALKATYDHDTSVLEEVVNLVEYPTVITGQFEREYLAVPSAVSIKVMKSHQRYFPMYQNGKLIRSFGVVHNVLPAASSEVKKGHERVVRARLADGKFFFEEDLKRPIDYYLEKLKKVVYQDKLGTVFEKCERIAISATCIANSLELKKDALTDIEAAAFLAKADLASDMVYEFPELQGYIGSVYAERIWCEGAVLQSDVLNASSQTSITSKPLKLKDPEGVIAASREHYLPKFNGDDLPATVIGKIISIADKLDSIIGIIGIGSKPSGSEDPFGLRRQMSGVIQMILESNWSFKLSELIEIAKQSYAETGREEVCAGATLQADLDDLIDGRYRFLLKENNVSLDIVDAVLPVWREQPGMVLAVSQALGEMRDSGGSGISTLADAVSAAIRIRNLSKKTLGADIDTKLFQEVKEKELYKANFVTAKKLAELQKTFQSSNLKKSEVTKTPKTADILNNLKLQIAELATLRTPVDSFFDSVLVNDPDPAIRDNRLKLLNGLDDLFLSAADLTKLSISVSVLAESIKLEIKIPPVSISTENNKKLSD